MTNKIRSRVRRGRKISTTNKKNTGCGVCGDGDGRYKCPKCRLPYCSVKCCKEHKEKCPAYQVTKDQSGSTSSTQNLAKSDDREKQNTKTSRYLPCDTLTADPLENSIRRRRMIDEGEEDDDDIEGWRITKEMMDNLDNSSWLRKELADGGLRQMISEIDSADDLESESGIITSRNNKRKRNIMKGCAMEMSSREIALMRARHNNTKFSKFLDKLLLLAGVLTKADDGPDDLSAMLEGEDGLGRIMFMPLEQTKNRISTDDMKLSEGDSEEIATSSSSSDSCNSSSDEETD